MYEWIDGWKNWRCISLTQLKMFSTNTDQPLQQQQFASERTVSKENCGSFDFLIESALKANQQVIKLSRNNSSRAALGENKPRRSQVGHGKAGQASKQALSTTSKQLRNQVKINTLGVVDWKIKHLFLHYVTMCAAGLNWWSQFSTEWVWLGFIRFSCRELLTLSWNNNKNNLARLLACYKSWSRQASEQANEMEKKLQN